MPKDRRHLLVSDTNEAQQIGKELVNAMFTPAQI